VTSSDASASAGASPRPDGRATRWAEHRLTRRAELVEATLRAVRRHGAGVGMDDIAAEAGTSKSVLYRHFADKAGLYLAVVESVDRLIARDLDHALTTVASDDQAEALIAHPEQVIEAAVDSYLALVEKDPEVYRFVVTHPLLDRPMGDDPLTGLTSRIGDQLAALITAALAASGREAAAAGALAHGVVGLVRAAADHWLTTSDPLPRSELTQQLSALIAGGLTAVLSPQEQP
jgi:AcrR family transcriptional regulator